MLLERSDISRQKGWNSNIYAGEYLTVLQHHWLLKFAETASALRIINEFTGSENHS